MLEMLIGPALGAIGSIFGAVKGGKEQEKATAAALALQKQHLGQVTGDIKNVYGGTQNMLMPFITGGQNAFDKLSAFTDPNAKGSGLNMLLDLIKPGGSMTGLEQTPGYNFALSQGLRGVNNMLAARGHGASPGAVAKGAAQFTTGLASQTWKDVVDRLGQAFQMGSGALQGQVNSGVSAGGALAGSGNALMQALMGTLGTTNAMAGNITGLGNAKAGMWTGIGNSLAGLGNSASQYAMLSKLMPGGGMFGGYNPGGSMYSGMPMFNPNVGAADPMSGWQ